MENIGDLPSVTSSRSLRTLLAPTRWCCCHNEDPWCGLAVLRWPKLWLARLVCFLRFFSSFRWPRRAHKRRAFDWRQAPWGTSTCSWYSDNQTSSSSLKFWHTKKAPRNSATSSFNLTMKARLKVDLDREGKNVSTLARRRIISPSLFARTASKRNSRTNETKAKKNVWSKAKSASSVPLHWHNSWARDKAQILN